ncbi:hypothetical protein TRSC58_05646 [Trypanosoma rangeli SC58]|uniref:Uncharacterized protein n=1 Tax=Trypanosoma rangeli SC58 TaxID=429131 RepID=A0A061J082_TRYRA|nr:hypothetical protein TRSC58_05646 [Trypanosoma rangeli SC58]
MVSRGNAATRVRPRCDAGNLHRGVGKSFGQPETASRRLSTPLTSSNALFSLGPYTYIVRQPARMDLPGETRCRSVSNGKGQKQLGERRRGANGKMQKQEREQDEEPTVWTSPVAPPRKGRKELAMASETPDASAFSPLPYSPWPVGANEGKNCDNGGGEQEQGRTPTPLNAPQQQQRGTNSAASSATLLSELLRRVQKSREVGVCSSPLSAQRKAAEEGEKEMWASPQPQKQQQQNYYRQKKKQRSTQGCSLASRPCGDIEEQRNTPDRQAARHRGNVAPRFIGVDAGREKGVFTDSSLTVSATPPTDKCASLDTMGWGDKLWNGIKEDEERLCRWITQRGLFPREDAAALRVFTEYLKKKTARLERDYDELFWFSRQRPPPELSRVEERLRSHDHSPRPSEKSTEQQRSATPGVGGPSGGHTYSIDATADAGRSLRSAFAPRHFLTKGAVRRTTCWAGGGEFGREMSTMPTSCCRDGAEKSTPFASSLRDCRWSTTRLHTSNASRDVSLFYTGHSLAAAVDGALRRDAAAGRSSSTVSPLYSARQEKITTRHGRHPPTDRSTSPPPPRHQQCQEGKEMRDIGKAEGNVPAVLEPRLNTLSVDEAISTAAPTADCTSCPSAESQVSIVAPKNSFSPPNAAGIEDVSALIRLRSYCGQLDAEFMRLFREDEAQHQCSEVKRDMIATVAGATKREPAHPVYRVGATTTEATNCSGRRLTLVSPPPPTSLPTASALLAGPQQVPETACKDNAFTQFNVSSVSFPSYGEHGSISATHHGEPWNESGSAKAVSHKPLPTLRRDIGKEAHTPPVSLMLSTSSLEEGRHHRGAQGATGLPVPPVYSCYISPTPHEIRTVTPSGDINAMECGQSIVVSQAPGVNQSMHHTSSLLSVPTKGLSWNGANSHDAADQSFPPRSKENAPEMVPTWNPGSTCLHLVESDVALEQTGRGAIKPPILDRNVAPAEDIGGSVSLHEAVLSTDPHETTVPLDSSKINQSRQVSKLVAHKSSVFRAEGESGDTSTNSLYSRTKKRGSRRRNRGPGSVTWSSSSSSRSEGVCGVDLDKQGQLLRNPNGRERFGLLMGSSTPTAATPIAQSRSYMMATNQVGCNLFKTQEKRNDMDFVIRGEGGGGGGLSVVHGGGSNQSTPQKNASLFFVGVINSGGRNDRSHRAVERRDGGVCASRPRRFGVSKNIH